MKKLLIAAVVALAPTAAAAIDAEAKYALIRVDLLSQADCPAITPSEVAELAVANGYADLAEFRRKHPTMYATVANEFRKKSVRDRYCVLLARLLEENQ